MSGQENVREIYSWTEPSVPMSPATFIIKPIVDPSLRVYALDVTARGTINVRGEMAPQGNLIIPVAEARKLWRALGEFIALETLRAERDAQNALLQDDSR